MKEIHTIHPTLNVAGVLCTSGEYDPEMDAQQPNSCWATPAPVTEDRVADLLRHGARDCRRPAHELRGRKY